MAEQVAVALENVGKTYGSVVALEGFSLEVSRGELICLLVPSGCGKTTTLRIVAGFVSPTQGRVLIEDTDVTAQPPLALGTGSHRSCRLGLAVFFPHTKRWLFSRR